MFVLSPQVGPPYFPFVFVLGYINPSCSDPPPEPPATTTTIVNRSLLCVCWHFTRFSPERGDRKSGNRSHVFSESVRTAELFQLKTSENVCPLSFSRLCLPHVGWCISSPLAPLAPVKVLFWPLSQRMWGIKAPLLQDWPNWLYWCNIIFPLLLNNKITFLFLPPYFLTFVYRCSRGWEPSTQRGRGGR